MKTYVILSLMILFFSNEILAQKVKDDDISFKYKRLPSNPINKIYTSYKGEVILSYEADDKNKMAEYDRKKAESDQQFKESKKIADEKYDKEKKEYKEKSFKEKIVDKALGDNDKPNKESVEKEGIKKPFIHKIFDKDFLATTYIKLTGYEKSNNSNLIVTFVAHGVEWLEPKINESYTNSSTGQPKKQYSEEIKYRSPVSVKVVSADGKTILDETVEKTNEYRSWSSNKYDSNEQLQANSDPEKVIPGLEQKILEDNLKIANEYLNEKCGSSIMQRKTILFNVESKKLDYSDYQQAYISAMEGYTLLIDNPSEAAKKLQSSITIWENAMKESNPKDKKARVNEEITIATVFNLAEAYMWTNDFTKAKLIFAKSSTLDLSRKENKRIDELKLMIDELKLRYEANQNM
ncbi:MAG: hypothetical protein NTW49_02560 [Bacteroidia bacterium]|nr:hypothetical protein [Bacteroidia bacterium]